MAFVTRPDDAVTTRRITTSDIYILDSRAHARSAEKSKVMQYVRAELKRMIKVTEAYGYNVDVRKHEKIKAELAKSGQEFVGTCKEMIKSLVVDAALRCRAETGKYDYDKMVRSYLKPAFEKVYGKVFE